MSFEFYEGHPERGQPVEMYRFQYGPGTSVYYYTNAEQDYRFQGHDYIAVPISRENVRTNGKADEANVDLRFPISVNLANLFLGYPPTQPVRVTIFMGHIGDPDEEFKVAFVGTVQSASREGDESLLTCSSDVVSLNRVGLRKTWQFACPLMLYGPSCRADMNAATLQAEVVGLTDTELTLEADWWNPYLPKDFVRGMLRWTSELGEEYRSIVGVSETGGIRFTGVIRGIEVGDMIKVIRGCDHKPSGCDSHNNQPNYGGCRWIPLKNPVKDHPYW